VAPVGAALDKLVYRPEQGVSAVYRQRAGLDVHVRAHGLQGLLGGTAPGLQERLVALLLEEVEASLKMTSGLDR